VYSEFIPIVFRLRMYISLESSNIELVNSDDNDTKAIHPVVYVLEEIIIFI
jgi:hypothetical protein